MIGAVVVIGIPIAIFCLGYTIGVSSSESLAHKYIGQKGLMKDFDDWVARIGGMK